MFVRVTTIKPKLIDHENWPQLPAGVVIVDPDERALNKLQAFAKDIGGGRHEITKTWPVMGGLTFTVAAIDIIDRKTFEVLEQREDGERRSPPGADQP